MRAADQFHLGIVTDRFERCLNDLTDLLGYEWCDEIGFPIPVELPTGTETIELRFAYSKTTPRLEIIRAVPGTLWVPVTGGAHHLGYWSDDVAADSARLVARGFEVEAVGRQPDGAPYWSYHRSPSGPRIELVGRAMEAALQHYWDSGKMT